MADHAVSDSPEVQAQLDRLTSLSPGADVLGLERITRLLANLGDPHLALPPVFHVAGTNGKGSTCAFLRAALQAEGYSVHAYTSPHLVRFNERIRLNDRLIDDARLAAYLERVLDTAGDIGPSFSRRPPPPPSSPLPNIRPMPALSRWDWAAGSTPPT